MVINTPHNPRAMLSAAEVRQSLCAGRKAVGAWVLCDEAYRWIDVPGGDGFGPPMVELGRRGLSVGTISKPFGLPGLRLGWMAGPADIVTQCWHMRDYVSLSRQNSVAHYAGLQTSRKNCGPQPPSLRKIWRQRVDRRSIDFLLASAARGCWRCCNMILL
ncbi:MAG: aminotransferase class I/II-fold pyridoxal phosphate-dependent enzyme [Caldilineaceae bacterium]